MQSSFLSEIILVIAAAFIGGFAARSLRLPPVLGYIVSGVVFGIVGHKFFESYDTIVSLSQFGVSLLLFTLGFEISFDVLKKINKRVFIVGILSVALVAAALLPLLFLFGIGFKLAIILSVLFSFSSTAVIVKILEEKGMLNDFPGNNVFIYLLIQDFFIVPVIFFLPFLFTKNSFDISTVTSFLVAAGKPLIIFAAVFFASRLFLSRIINFLFRYPSHELTILASIFTATLSILLLTAVGLPETIAAFLAGILISEQGKNLTPLSEIRPFRDLFLVLFFVVTGMLLNFNFFISNLPFIVGLTASILIVKFAVLYVILRVSHHSPSSSVFISSHLSNIGEFSIVIGQIALLSFFISQKEYDMVLSIFILSLMLVPLWLRYSIVVMEKIARLGFLKAIMREENQTLPKAVTKQVDRHVVICGHGRVGRETRAMLELAGIDYVVVDFNKKVINELLAQSKYAIYGDPTDTDILKAAFIDSARVLVIAVPDTFSQKKIINLSLKLNPKLTVICRSHIEEDKYDLVNLGVNRIVMPETEAGFRIGAEVLELFNVDDEEAESYIKRLRRQHLL